MKIIQKLLKRRHEHRKPEEMPSRVRRRLYTNLLDLMEEERATWDLLGTTVKPRLSIVDEERVVMIRPYDRQFLNLDEEMQRAREDKGKKEQQARKDNENEVQRAREDKSTEDSQGE